MHDRPIDPMAIEMFVDLLRSAHGEKLLRMKAIVALSDNLDRPLVLHGVQSIFHPPQRLQAWPDPHDRRTRMVLITKDLSEDFVKDLFAAFTGTATIDRPDRQAMTDNPSRCARSDVLTQQAAFQRRCRALRVVKSFVPGMEETRP